jgi:VanZ family protein
MNGATPESSLVNQIALPPLPRLVSLVLPPLAMMGLIFFLSAQPSDGDHGAVELVLRKLGHVSEYTALTFLWVRALVELRAVDETVSAFRAAAVLSLLYASSDEFHQTFVEGRHGTPVDVVIDAIGMSIALAFAARAYARRRRRTVGPSRPRAA